MNMKTVLPLLAALALGVCVSAQAREERKPLKADAPTDAEAKAKADYEQAEAEAKAAEAAVGPLKTAMQKADTAYAAAKKIANAKRQQATDAKALAGEAGEKELKQAEASVPAAIKALEEATAAKPGLDKALEEAKAVATPLQQTYEAAEKAAKTAEIAAKAALEAANKVEDEAKKATAAATAKRRAAETAKAALGLAQRSAQQAVGRAATAAAKLAEAEAAKKAADEALAKAPKPSANGAKPANGNKNGKANAPDPQKLAEAAEQARARAEGQKKLADAGVVKANAKIAAATAALAAAEKAEQEAAALAETRQRAANDVAARRKAATAAGASQAAKDAAKEILALDEASRLATADAVAKRKAANDAKTAAAPKQQILEKAAIAANSGGQKLSQAETRKKSAEEGLASLKQRIAAAKQSHVADEKAAVEAENAALPLKAEADKTRAAYTAALKAADDKRTAAEQAKAGYYRIVAAGRISPLMESAAAPQPAGRVDEIVFARLKALGIAPVLCSDAVFIRRASLDTTGKLPTAEEAKEFINSSDPNKRTALIDRLLDSPAHIDYWAMKWCDILRVKAEFPVKIWPNAAQAYHRWVWESIAQNKTYDKFARELLTSSGSNFRVGPVNFYRAIPDRNAEGIASAVGLALMGTRIHLWPEDRRSGMAVFFSQVGYKPTSEWKEEIVFWDPLKSAAVAGSTAPGLDAIAKCVTTTNQIPQNLPQPISENGPLPAVFPDGTKTTIPPDRDPREVFADWLIRAENPWFAAVLVNRTWSWVMGRGIIHEPDDVRPDNPPSNPELLAYLQREFIASGFDMKRLKRLIFASTAYQFSSVPRFKGAEARAAFASYLLRRVEAEVLIDALNNITGSTDLYTSAVPEPFTYIPKGVDAVELADGSITSSFLTLFGRSARATGMEAERVNELASPQWLHMLNSATIQNKLQNGPKLLAMISAGGKPQEIAERLYLTVLSRMPTAADLQAAEEYAKLGATRGRDLWIDLTWALINSPEFLLRH